ncbi:MAG TPA: hypothetical protein VJN18_03565 [Polyangiaceae bacterium]|nr:hypothetical protein [Polyangiaceae bacterium]
MGFLEALRGQHPADARAFEDGVRRYYQNLGDAELGEIVLWSVESEKRCSALATALAPLSDWFEGPFDPSIFPSLRCRGGTASLEVDALGEVQLARIMTIEKFVKHHLIDDGKVASARDYEEALRLFRDNPEPALLLGEIRGTNEVTFATPEEDFVSVRPQGADELRDAMALPYLMPPPSGPLGPVYAAHSQALIVMKYRARTPMHVPTILDAAYAPWFGPTGEAEPCGWTRHLKTDQPVLREVVHEPISAAQVDSVELDVGGPVTTSPPTGWRNARGERWTKDGHVRAP